MRQKREGKKDAKEDHEGMLKANQPFPIPSLKTEKKRNIKVEKMFKLYRFGS